jgi:DNA-binding SARP family transcriptional activator
MEIHLLGPVEVLSSRGDRAQIGSSKQRALLAFLALQPHRLVTVDALVENLWGDTAPDGSTKALRFHVSRLRRALRQLGGGDVLQTRPGGYLLAVDDDMIDACCFETAVACARSARTAGAHPDVIATMLREALELWRGEPLADVGHEPFVPGERRRLEDLRLAAVEEYFATELLAGRHAEAVGELERAVAQHPLRERLWELLITALYRSSRQADALAAYQRLRRMLVEELGIEPSEPLRALESRILLQQEQLASSPRPPDERDAPHGEATDEGAAPGQAPPDDSLEVEEHDGPAAGAGAPPHGSPGGQVSGAGRTRSAVAVLAGAFILGAAALGIAVALFLADRGRAGSTAEDGDTRPASELAAGPDQPSFPPGEEISPYSLQVGDCFDTLPLERPSPDGGSLPVDPAVLRVDCDSPHEQEAFHIFELPSGPYPGAAEVGRLSYERCADAFERYVGTAPRFSVLTFLYVMPGEADWAASFRWGGCSLYRAAGGELVGSMAGSRR